MYSLEIMPTAYKKFKKLERKDKNQLININNKLKEILENPYRFKPLRKPLQNIRRVHIGKSFVLLFSIDEHRKAIIIQNYDHHDNIYKV